MNRAQRRCLVGGLALVVLMSLFPPLGHQSRTYGKVDFDHYGFITENMLIDQSRLMIGYVAVACVTGCLLFLLQDRPK